MTIDAWMETLEILKKAYGNKEVCFYYNLPDDFIPMDKIIKHNEEYDIIKITLGEATNDR